MLQNQLPASQGDPQMLLIQSSTSYFVRVGLCKDRDCEQPIVLEKILLYPIKSCGGFAPEAWPIGPNGEG